MSWRDLAACRGKEPLFFPPHAERPETRARRERRCMEVCDQCPVRSECREWISKNPEDCFGMVVAGLTYDERINIVERRSRYIQVMPSRAS